MHLRAYVKNLDRKCSSLALVSRELLREVGIDYDQQSHKAYQQEYSEVRGFRAIHEVRLGPPSQISRCQCVQRMDHNNHDNCHDVE
jgi:hypothetical protein